MPLSALPRSANVGGPTVDSRRLVAVLATLFLAPGAGHMLVGRWGAAIGWFLLWPIAIVAVPFSIWPVVIWLVLVRVIAALELHYVSDGTRPAPHLVLALLGTAAIVAATSFAGQVARTHWAEGFRIPAASMAPTVQVGDHLLVKKFARNPERGDVIVFANPCQPNRDYLKRVVAVGGDSVELRCDVLYINEVAVDRAIVDGECRYDDVGELGDVQSIECVRYREHMDGRYWDVVQEPGSGEEAGYLEFPRDHVPSCPNLAPGTGEETLGTLVPVTAPASGECGQKQAYVVPKDHVFVLGDNRPNSSDSRIWGAVAVSRIKGTAAYVWFSKLGDAIRWTRVGTAIR